MMVYTIMVEIDVRRFRRPPGHPRLIWSVLPHHVIQRAIEPLRL